MVLGFVVIFLTFNVFRWNADILFDVDLELEYFPLITWMEGLLIVGSE